MEQDHKALMTYVERQKNLEEEHRPPMAKVERKKI
jgi:hypothetical protein